jgi:hypothetical protein
VCGCQPYSLCAPDYTTYCTPNGQSCVPRLDMGASCVAWNQCTSRCCYNGFCDSKTRCI